MTTTSLAETVAVHDEYGEDCTIEVFATETADGYIVEVFEECDLIDNRTVGTIDQAAEMVKTLADKFKADDDKAEKARTKDQRQYRRECLNGIADEFDGADEKVARMLAKLIGQGKGKEALAALRGVK